MKLKEWLRAFHFEKLKFKSKLLEAEISWQDQDREAAWELYIELLTRIATQPLKDEDGIEKTTLESLHKLFPITREILKRKGRKCVNFTKIAIVILNQILRPFTSKWHKISLEGGFENSKISKEFRTNVREIQHDLIIWTRMLADIADVEDLTDFDMSGE